MNMLLQDKKDYQMIEDAGGQVFILETVGGMPYVSLEKLAQRWDLAKNTVQKYVREIEDIIARTTEMKHLIGRYPEESVIGAQKGKRVNEFVFADYYNHRRMLRDPLKARFVREFSVSRYAGLMGYFNRPVREWDDSLPVPEKKKKKEEKAEEVLFKAFKKMLKAASE